MKNPVVIATASASEAGSNLDLKTRSPRRPFGPPRNDVSGTVYFVGAGPGDPELITRKGFKLLAQADCVLYDRLVDPRLLQSAPAGCEKIYVGKKSDEGGLSQRLIHRLLVEKAALHRKIIRLKGGDPTLFGRIAEEIEALLEHRIPFEIIPGVSSAWGAAAAAGIPLTDRRFSSSVAIVTGQEAGQGKKVRWETLAKAVDTIVVLMGRARLGEIVRRLRAGGASASTPVALIRQATRPQQKVLVSTLGRIRQDLEKHPEFGPPVVAVVGEVVGSRWRLPSAVPPKGGTEGRNDKWTLEGKRVLVTRPAADNGDLTRRLKALGAQCVHLPTIVIRQRRLTGNQRNSLLAELPKFDWVLFTSHHGVEGLAAQARGAGKKLPRLIQGKVCAIGPRTEQAVKEAGLSADLVPSAFSTEGMERAFRRIPLSGKKVLIPRSNLGRGDRLARLLRRRGAQVREVVLYETLPATIPHRRVKKALDRLDVATFTSASTVRFFFEALRKAGAKLNGVKVAAIGPKTQKELEAFGVSKVYLPGGSWTVEGLVEAVIEACVSGDTILHSRGTHRK